MFATEELIAKLREEADKSKTAARPNVTISDVMRELLSRPLHPHARVRGGAS